MGNVIAKFGRCVCKITPEHPQAGRRLLLAGFGAFGLKLRLAPDKRLPPSRQYVARYVNQTLTGVLSHPERAAMVSVFMPCELLEAMDIVPMCAELYAAFMAGAGSEAVFAETAEAAGIPETYCSYHKVLLGSAYAGVLPAPAMVVNTSLVCDANNLTFRELAAHYGIPQYYVEVPPEQSEESLRYVEGQLRELAAFLQDKTGRRLEEDRLRQALVRSRNTIELFRACQERKAGRRLPGDLTSEMYEIYMTHNALGTAQAQRYARTLLADLEAAPPAHGLRLLWLHTIPFWQEPARQALNFSGRCQVVSCDMNFEGLVDIDPDRPYESMARRLVYSRWNGGGERVAAAVDMARALSVDGVICFCHWGCKQTMGLSAVLKTTLEENGFPTLIINGDGCDRRNTSDGQTATRLNAFLEMLEEARHD